MNDPREAPSRLLVTGLNWSGSGTVVGLLREFEGVVQVPGGVERIAPAGYFKLGEFNDFRLPGMVGDQLDCTNSHWTPSVIKSRAERKRRRELPRTVIKSLVRSRRPAQLLERLVQGRQISRLNELLSQLASDFEANTDLEYRVARAQRWISDVIQVAGQGSAKAAVFDQPINIGQHDSYWPRVFAPFKLIIVHRDPRDQFAEWIRHGYLTKLPGDIGYLYGWDLAAAIRYRIDSMRARMLATDDLIAKLKLDQVLLLSFEQLVLDYDAARARITEFARLELSGHVYPRKYFDPTWSSRNVGIHRSSPLPMDEHALSELLEWHRERSEVTL